MWSALIEIWIHIILALAILAVIGLFALFWSISGSDAFADLVDDEIVRGDNQAHSQNEDRK